jgi:hypothetical protein
MVADDRVLDINTTALTHNQHAQARLFPLAFLTADVAVDRNRPALPAQNRLALSAVCACDAPCFDRHALALSVTLVFV